MRWTLMLVGSLACSSQSPRAQRGHEDSSTPIQRAPQQRTPLNPPSPDSGVAFTPKYPLDLVSRKTAITGDAKCPPVGRVRYAGEVVAMNKPIEVHPAFVGRVRRLEEIARDVGIQFYGRAPTRIEQFGSYYCRRVRAWPYLISEHGLANALDVGAFRFPATREPEVEPVLRGSFVVSVARHWHGNTRHAQFLRAFAKRIIEEPELFRVILGPADPAHQDHFHFDMAPERIVNVF